MAIALNGSVTLDGNALASNGRTLSVTVPSGSNRALIVCLADEDSADTVTGITYGGVALTKAIDNHSTSGTASIWYLLNPTVGTANLVFALSGSMTDFRAAALNYTGVKQSSPIGNTGTNNGSSTALTVNCVRSVADSLMISSIMYARGVTSAFTPVAGVTERVDAATSVSTSVITHFVGERIEATTGSLNTGATVATSDTWRGCAAEFLPFIADQNVDLDTSTNGIASTAAFGDLTTNISANPTGIASTAAFGTLNVQNATIQPSGIAPTAAFGTAAVSVEEAAWYDSGAGANANTTINVPYPASVVANDVLVMELARSSGGSGSPTTPSGWTSRGSKANGSGGTLFAYSKVADGSETGNLAVTVTAGGDWIGRMHGFRHPVPGVWSFDTGGVSNGSDGTIEIPSVTIGGDNGVTVSLVYNQGSATVSAATGETGGDYVQPVAVYNNGSHILDMQYAKLSAAGTISGGVAATSGNNWACISFGFHITLASNVEVDPTGIASTAAFGTAKLNLNVTPTAIASTAAFGTAKLNLNVSPAGIAPAATFGTPNVQNATISPTGISSTAAFGTASVSNVGADQDISDAGGIGPQPFDGPQFITPTLILDGSTSTGSFQTVDLSSLIPKFSTGVILRFLNTSGGTRKIGARKNGSVDTRTDNLFNAKHAAMIVGVDDNRIVELSMAASSSSLKCQLLGYFGPETVFLTDPVEFTGLSGWPTWDTRSIAAYTGDDTPIAAIVMVDGTFLHGIRKTGSTDNRATSGQPIYTAIVGVDGSQQLDLQVDQNVNSRFWLVGYMKAGATLATNATDVSLSATNTFTDLSALPGGAVGGIYQWFGTSFSTNGMLRKNGSSDTTFQSPEKFAFDYSEADGSGIVEAAIDNTSLDLFQVGSFEPYESLVGGTQFGRPTIAPDQDITDAGGIASTVAFGDLGINPPQTVSVTSIGSAPKHLVEFTNGEFDIGGPLASIADASQGIISFWYLNESGTDEYLIWNSGDYHDVYVSHNTLQITLAPSDFSSVIQYTNADGWADGLTHVAIAYDTQAQTVGVWINGVLDTNGANLSVSGSPFTMDLTSSGNWSIGYSGSTGATFGEFFWAQEYLDFTVSANLQKFYNSGVAVDLGADGSLPTGSQPIIYLQGDDGAFGVNSGYGGDFTHDAGSLADGGNIPVPPTTAFGTPELRITTEPVGIASTLAFGTPIIENGQTVQVTGIAPTTTFGTPRLDLNIAATGIAPTEAFGTAKLNLNVSPAGIASTVHFGTPRLDLNVSPTGIAPTEHVGTPQLNLNITASGIAPTEAFGTPKLNLNVTVTGIPSTVAFGTPRVDQNVVGNGIAPTTTFGTARVDENVDPVSIAPTTAFGTARLDQNITASGIPATTAFGTPLVSNAGALSVVPVGIASTVAFGTPTIQPGAVDVSPVGIASTEAFGTARLDLNVNPAGRASAAAFGTPTITTGAVNVSPAGIAPTTTFGAARLDLNVDVDGLGSTTAFGTPTVVPPTATVAPAGIAATTHFGTAAVQPGSVDVDADGIASTTIFGTPSIQPGPVTVFAEGIARTTTFGTAVIEGGGAGLIQPTGIPSGVRFGTLEIAAHIIAERGRLLHVRAEITRLSVPHEPRTIKVKAEPETALSVPYEPRTLIVPAEPN